MKAIKTGLQIWGVLAVLALMPVTSFANDACKETNPDKFFELINAAVQAYIPALDRNGVPLLSENDLFVQKSQHYFAEYREYEPVSISMERFAAVTENNQTALENFESKITVIGPNCSLINLYRSRLVGAFEASFDEIMELIALGIRTNNDSIIEFASSQLTPKSLSFPEVIKVLENDLALNEDVIVRMMPDYLRTQFIQTEKVPLNSMSEMALLAFSSMGGVIDSDVQEVYIFIPNKQGGLPVEQETILLTSDAMIYEISGFDYQTAAAVLSRIGIRPSVVSLAEVKTARSGHCQMDMAGQWMQVVKGKKLRMCPFPELVRQMLKDKTFYEIVDYQFQSVVFDAISQILDES
ncbi:MAG: hypothetical protein ACON5P_08975 [Candidatus Puniceispirillaceae bacterium]